MSTALVPYRQLSCRPWEATALVKTSSLWLRTQPALPSRPFPGRFPQLAGTVAEFKNVGARERGGAWHSSLGGWKQRVSIPGQPGPTLCS